MSSNNNTTPKIIGTFIIISFIAVGSYVFIYKPITKEDTVAQTTQQNTPEPTNITSTQPTNTAVTEPKKTESYYSKTVSYVVPKFNNEMTVKLTLDSTGTITAVSTSHVLNPRDKESAVYVEDFNAELSGVIVGKKISNVEPSIIAGASLTSEAFYDALSQINTEING